MVARLTSLSEEITSRVGVGDGTEVGEGARVAIGIAVGMEVGVVVGVVAGGTVETVPVSMRERTPSYRHHSTNFRMYLLACSCSTPPRIGPRLTPMDKPSKLPGQTETELRGRC